MYTAVRKVWFDQNLDRIKIYPVINKKTMPQNVQ